MSVLTVFTYVCVRVCMRKLADILAYSSSDFACNSKYRIPKGADDRTFLAGSYNGWDIQEVGVWLV